MRSLKKTKQKLVLNKKTIATLSNVEMGKLFAGVFGPFDHDNYDSQVDIIEKPESVNGKSCDTLQHVR